MTDYSKMTDGELNEAIFRARGWQKIEGVALTTHINKDGRKTRQYAAPDYCHDWRLCGELLEDLLRNGEHLYFDMTKKKYGIGGELDDSALTAICKRWLAWKEAE